MFKISPQWKFKTSCHSRSKLILHRSSEKMSCSFAKNPYHFLHTLQVFFIFMIQFSASCWSWGFGAPFVFLNSYSIWSANLFLFNSWIPVSSFQLANYVSCSANSINVFKRTVLASEIFCRKSSCNEILMVSCLVSVAPRYIDRHLKFVRLLGDNCYLQHMILNRCMYLQLCFLRMVAFSRFLKSTTRFEGSKSMILFWSCWQTYAFKHSTFFSTKNHVKPFWMMSNELETSFTSAKKV